MSTTTNFFNVKVERGDFAVLLEQCRKKKEFTDVQLQVGDKLFDAHRNILSLYSPVLKEMISDQWSKEEIIAVMKAMINEQWSMTKICLINDECVDPEIMEDLLSFLYTGKIQLTPDNVHQVCKAAYFLDITTLVEPCVKYLCQLLNIGNVLEFFEFSTAHELEALSHSCLKMVSKKHERIFHSSQILEFSADNFVEMIEGLKKFRAEKLRENTFHCIVRWMRQNLQERWNELPVLLKSIPLEELPFEFLTQTVSNHSLVKGSISSIEAVSAALANYQTYSDSLTTQNLVVIDYISNIQKATYEQTMSCYDSHTGLWRDLPAMPILKTSFGFTVVNQKDIIICGGVLGAYEHRPKSKSVDKFDWATQTWEKLPDMPITLAGLSIVEHKGYLYAAGGIMGQRHGPTSNFLRYSFETKRWKKITPMNIARSDGSLLEYKNQLYAIGGNTQTVERYDPARNKWTMMASMNMKYKFHIVAAIHQDKIYAFGSGSFEEYDPTTNVWKSLPEPPMDYGSSLVSMNGKLLILGGYRRMPPRTLNYSRDNRVTDWIYEFNIQTQKWIEFGKLDQKRDNHVSLVGMFNSASA